MSEGFHFNRAVLVQSGINWNLETNPGFFKGTDLLNAPVAGEVFVIVNGDGQTNTVQQAYSADNPANFYYRTQANGIWSGWSILSGGGGGGGSVASVFGRTGAVLAANGDYTAEQITNTPIGSFAFTNVQDALDHLFTQVDGGSS